MHAKKSDFQIRLERFDRDKGISARALELARKRRRISDLTSNAGRNLIYYHGLLEKMEQKLGNAKGHSFLHLGGANGVLTKFLQERGGRAVNFEFDPKLCEMASELGNKNIVQGDALETLPFKKNTFDALVSDRFVLGGYRAIDRHLTPETRWNGSEAIIKEASRVVKPHGFFFVNGIAIHKSDIGPQDIERVCRRYFRRIEPYFYNYELPGKKEGIFVPGLILSDPKK
ncbi:MAG: class I SAM-dependent methyltransferase [Candidatus Diapherotrites archaeon]|nr:class I SAM-dependent methyltransferase [Candidatus Diapherotrites archaeon]